MITFGEVALFCFVSFALWNGNDGQRPCFNRLYDFDTVKLDIKTEYFTRLLKNVSLELIIRVKFDVISKEMPIDGLMLNFGPVLTSETLYPANTCVSSNSSLWLNQSSCPEYGTPVCPRVDNITARRNAFVSENMTMNNFTMENMENIMMENSTKKVLCSVSNCTFLGTCFCRGTPVYLQPLDGSFYSIPIEVKSLEWVGKFHESYQLKYMPYYRQYAQIPEVKGFFPRDCHGIVQRTNNVTLAEAIAICCDAGVLHFEPLALQVSDIRPNFTNHTAEILLTWMPPVYQAEYDFTVGLLSTRSSPFISKNIKDVKIVPSTNVSEDLKTPCYNSTFSYQVEISTLGLSSAYQIYVRPNYSNRVKARYCRNFLTCRAFISVDFLEIDLCDDLYNPCDVETEFCRRIFDNTSATVNYTCVERCNELNMSHVTALEFEVNTIAFNITTQLASVTLQWLPPIDQQYNPTFKLITNSQNFVQRPLIVQKVKSNNVPLHLQAPCYNSSFSYRITLYDLPINVSYNFSIKSIYPTAIQQKHCSEEQSCLSTRTLNLPEINFCELRFDICKTGLRCKRDTTRANRYTCNSSSLIKMSVAPILIFQICVYILFIF